MRPYAQSNKGFNYILTVIDVLSKYAWAFPLKIKSGSDVTAALSKIFREDKRYEKGYTPNWSTEIFHFAKVQRTNPATYLLRDYRGEPIVGGFYEYELQRVSNPNVYLVEKVLCKRGSEVYVKWLGMDNSHNSWINKADVL
ncbi:hypothetical protein ALC62_16000 [Cyphomyrmex costatus]|uniref:Chromo domain-containing protein n=1 Tax=Cyphomyrmex costatus TaxID=456900 RepID=A0A151I656_9HYME|nr:hypothetical protein ALC62_16000 [Cyphomyrmex costatus]